MHPTFYYQQLNSRQKWSLFFLVSPVLPFGPQWAKFSSFTRRINDVECWGVEGVKESNEVDSSTMGFLLHGKAKRGRSHWFPDLQTPPITVDPRCFTDMPLPETKVLKWGKGTSQKVAGGGVFLIITAPMVELEHALV
ncbi:hypothetical protein V6N12_017382 [Hibiscus sabdariffa]|uniref:Uncharacterized protein n=1 Tax=Hibiscus sabdariffa TaxID=183260 RepID=A0ABR2CFB5_9ROSI